MGITKMTISVNNKLIRHLIAMSMQITNQGIRIICFKCYSNEYYQHVHFIFHSKPICSLYVMT